MSDEPEVTIQYDKEHTNLLDKKYYHSVIRRLRSEIEVQEDSKRAAILCHEIGRIFEDQMADLFQASTHYQEALSKSGEFLPAIRALRRISFVRGNWSQYISLTDQELAGVGDDHRRSQLWLERAEVLHSQLGDADETMVSIKKSIELDPANQQAMWFMDSLLREKKEYDELVRILENLAARVDSNDFSASLLYDAGRINEVYREDLDAALPLYEAVIEKDPENPRGLKALHRLYYKKKMWRPLIKIMMQSVSKAAGRKKARILYTVSRILQERLSEISEAIGRLEEAHQADPESILIIGELVRLCQLVGMYEKLAHYYDKQIKLTEDNKEKAAIHLRLGQLYEEDLRDDDKAEEGYKQAIEENPHYLPAFVQLATFYQKRGKTDNLISMHMKEAEITESPIRRALAYHRAAELRESQEKTDEAVELYNKAISTVSSFTPSFNALERLLEKNGDYAKLVLLYQERLYEEDNVNVKLSLMEKTARILEERLHNKEAAVKGYREILKADPGNNLALRALVRITAEEEQWLDHIEFLQLEVEHSEDEEHIVNILQRIGEIYLHHLNDETNAVETYKRLLSISPFYPHAIRNLGRIYHRRGMTKELIELHQSELGTATDPEERSLLLYKIAVLTEESLDDINQAVAIYRNAVMENPRNMAAAWALYRIYRKNGDWLSILEVLESEAASIPEGRQRALALVRIGELWEESLERGDMAYDSYNQALRMEQGLPEAREALIRLCEQEGNFDFLSEMLFQEFQTAVDSEDQYRKAIELGELWLDRLNNPKEAADWFMKALSIKPSALVPLRNLEFTFRTIGEWKSLAEIKKKMIDSAPDEHSKIAFIHDLQMIKNRLNIKSGPDADEEKLISEISFGEKDTARPFDIILEHLIRSSKNNSVYLKLLEARKENEEVDAVTKSIYECMVGEVLMKEGRTEDAIERFEKAAELDDASIIPLLFLENITFELKDAEKNIDVAGRLIARMEKDSMKAEIYQRTAQMKIEVLDRHEDGVKDFMEALRLNPENEDCFNNIIRIMGKEGRWNELIPILEDVAEKVRSPKKISEFFSVLGNLQWKHMGDASKAIKSLNKVLKYDPHKLPALMGLLDLYIHEEQINEAIAISKYILSKISDSGAYLTAALRMSELIDKTGFDTDELMNALENLLKQNPDHYEVMEKLVVIYQKSSAWEKAADLLDRMADREHDSDRRMELLIDEAIIYEKDLVNLDMALSVYEKVLGIDPFSAETLEKMVKVMGMQGQWSKAADFLKSKIDEIDESQFGELKAKLLKELADINKLKLDNKENYLQNIQAAFDIDPSAPGTGKMLVDALIEEQKLNEAEKAIEKCLEVEPYNFDVLAAGIEQFSSSGKDDRAKICANLLFYSNDRDALVRDLAVQYRKETVPFQKQSVEVGDLAKIRVDDLDHPARRILDVVSLPGSKLLRRDYSDYGISKSENLVKKGDKGGGLLKECQKAARFLGVGDFEVYLLSGEGYDPVVEMLEQPAILFPISLAEFSALEQKVVIYMAMSQIRLSNFIPMRMSLTDFESFFVALVRIFNPGFGSEGSSMKKMKELQAQMEEEISGSQRKRLEPLVKEYVNSPWFDIEEWHHKMKCTAYRVALLGCGDIGTILDAMKKREPDLKGVPLSSQKAMREAFMKNEAARDIAAFGLSDTFLDLWYKYLKVK